MTTLAERLSGAKRSLAERLSGSAAGQFVKGTAPIVSDPSVTTRTLPRIGQRAAAKYASDILSTPAASGDMLAGAAAFATEAPKLVTQFAEGAQPFDLSGAFQRQQQQFPASALRALPKPSATDVIAGVGSVPSMFSGNLRQEFGQRKQAEEARRQQQPIASLTGDVLGDAAFMASARPLGRMALGTKRVQPFSSMVNKRRADTFASKVVGFWKDLGGLTAQAGTRGVGAGFEGALVAALGDGDPVKTAAWTAGTNAGMNILMAPAQAIGPGTGGLAKAAFAMWAAHETYKWIAPGPQEALQSKDEVIREIGLAMGLSAFATLAGASRNVSPGWENAAADMLSAGSRGAIASLVTASQEDSRVGNVLSAVTENVMAFKDSALIRLNQAAKGGSEAVRQEMDRLMEDPEFRELYQQRFGE